jgi:hypothetical protein
MTPGRRAGCGEQVLLDRQRGPAAGRRRRRHLRRRRRPLQRRFRGESRPPPPPAQRTAERRVGRRRPSRRAASCTGLAVQTRPQRTGPSPGPGPDTRNHVSPHPTAAAALPGGGAAGAGRQVRGGSFRDNSATRGRGLAVLGDSDNAAAACNVDDPPVPPLPPLACGRRAAPVWAALVLADSVFYPGYAGPAPAAAVTQRLEESVRVTCRVGTSRCVAAQLSPSGWRTDPPNRGPPASPANATDGPTGPVASQVFLKHCTALVGGAVFVPAPPDDPDQVRWVSRAARPGPARDVCGPAGGVSTVSPSGLGSLRVVAVQVSGRLSASASESRTAPVWQPLSQALADGAGLRVTAAGDGDGSSRRWRCSHLGLMSSLQAGVRVTPGRTAAAQACSLGPWPRQRGRAVLRACCHCLIEASLAPHRDRRPQLAAVTVSIMSH